MHFKKKESWAAFAIVPDVYDCCADVTQTISTWEKSIGWDIED